MINFNDIKKYGKNIMVYSNMKNQSLVQVIETIDNITHSTWPAMSAVKRRKEVIKECCGGVYGHQIEMAMKNIETMKTLDVL